MNGSNERASPTTEVPVPHEFIFSCGDAVAVMRGAGLNDAQIACIIGDIRSATLNEEFRRLRRLADVNPPHHHRWGEVMDAIRLHLVRNETDA